LPEDRTPRRRFEAKNRNSNRSERKLRWTWVLAGFSLILAAFATYVGLRSPMFNVDAVSVKGIDTLDGAALAEISGLQGESMFRLDLEAASANLLALPQVKSVSYERDWPNGVTIHIVERVPFAFWSVGGREYTVDADGIVLAVGAPSGPAPRIVEPDANRIMGPGDQVHPDALALAARITFESPRVVGQSVQVLEYRPSIGVTAVFTNGMRVTFGDERSYEYKVSVLSGLLEQLQARGVASPRAVDLRFGERVTYE
jgi:cell division protein FtsQ